MLEYMVLLHTRSLPELPMLKEEEEKEKKKANIEAIGIVKGRLRNMGAIGNLTILEDSGRFPTMRVKMSPMLAATIRKFPEVKDVQHI